MNAENRSDLPAEKPSLMNDLMLTLIHFVLEMGIGYHGIVLTCKGLS